MTAKARKTLHIIAACLVTLNLAGCASIVNGGAAKIAVNSQPSGASVSVYDASGQKVNSVQTPTVLHLKRGAGYFKSAKYRVVIEKDGYRRAEIELVSNVNGWYWGNLIFGGLIGMIVVDPLTGSMYRLAPKSVDQVLAPEHAAVIHEHGGLVVLLREDVPADLVASLEPLQVR